MFCFVSVLTVEKEKLIGLVSHQISVVTFDEVTPDLRSDAIIGCLIQSFNVKLITFFNQSQELTH